ncbi:MAG: YhbY family RNA-binding protein, partial [Opitutales bacterium]
MKPTPLTSAEKKELRGMAQRLKPHVHVGKNGL